MTFDPRIGRWLSENPIGFQDADPNLYRYVENNPTNFTDPSGRDKTYEGVISGANLVKPPNIPKVPTKPPSHVPTLGGYEEKYPKGTEWVDPPLFPLTKEPERDWVALTNENNVRPITVQKPLDLYEVKPKKTFKWVIDKQGKLVVVPLKDTPDGNGQLNDRFHPMGAGGGDVYAAGLGQLTDDGQVLINNQTGHYEGASTDENSVNIIAVKVWKDAGFKPKVVPQKSFPPLISPPRPKK